MKRMDARLKSKEKVKKLQEAVQIGRDAEDFGWTPITTGATSRDLPSMTQKRMQDIAIYLYDANPIAHRIPEMMKDFTIGDGYKFKADDEEVKKVLTDFWNDPDNSFDTKLDSKALELSLLGELFIKTFVNEHNGHVKLGYIDPGRVSKVLLDRNNPEIVEEVHWRKRLPNYGFKIEKMKVVNYDKAAISIKEPTYGKLTGDCFFFSVNRLASQSRGKSDLLSVADMIDAYDQFLFARLEKAILLNNFIWDVQCDGMDKGEIEDFTKNIQMPKPGSIRVHNEKIKWNTVAPKLESADASNEARLFKNQILAGAGYPGHYFASGETTTRSTSESMNLPTLKMLRSRQRYFTSMITFICKYVLDQAIIKGYLKSENLDFKIIASPIRERITFSKYEMKQRRGADDEMVGKTEEEKNYEEKH